MRDREVRAVRARQMHAEYSQRATPPLPSLTAATSRRIGASAHRRIGASVRRAAVRS